MPYIIFDVIERIRAAQTADETLQVLKVSVAAVIEPERACINHLLPGPTSSWEDINLASDIPDEWINLIRQKNLMRHDAALAQVRRTMEPYNWSDAVPTEQQHRWGEVVSSAHDYGVAEGVMIPIPGLRGPSGNVWIGGRGFELSHRITPFLQAVALHAFHHLDDLTGRSRAQTVSLSGRERDVLQWLAVGKTSADIGEILSISRRTVEWHIAQAMKKLGAANSVQAVVIALQRALIHP
jgi:DNA-binding CsgD family transcriptional regulator